MDGKLSVQTDCFPSEAGKDSRISGARGAAPCTERSDAKQPGQSLSGLSASQSARIQGLPCIEVRPCYQGLFETPNNHCFFEFHRIIGIVVLRLYAFSIHIPRLQSPSNRQPPVFVDFLHPAGCFVQFWASSILDWNEEVWSGSNHAYARSIR